MDHDGESITEYSEKQKMEKEQKCNDCDYTTSRKDHLKKHQEAIHEGVKHTCDMCGKQFTQESGVYNHKKSQQTCQIKTFKTEISLY